MIEVIIIVAIAIILILVLFRFGMRQKASEYEQINKYFERN